MVLFLLHAGIRNQKWKGSIFIKKRQKVKWKSSKLVLQLQAAGQINSNSMPSSPSIG